MSKASGSHRTHVCIPREIIYKLNFFSCHRRRVFVILACIEISQFSNIIILSTNLYIFSVFIYIITLAGDEGRWCHCRIERDEDHKRANRGGDSLRTRQEGGEEGGAECADI